ncbi:Hypothetical protein A7982_08949 [Minicystis rosea]|nr:Hypothetical protein A7982_08949 [Minicystis rosea]
MMRRACLLGCVVLAACTGSSEPEPSSELPASELVLGATIRSNGAVTQIEASLFAADNHSIVLAAPDRLLIALGSLESELVPLEARHVGQVATTGTDAAVILERADGERITSHVILPPPFVLIPPSDPVDTSQPVIVTWTPDPGGFTTHARVDCSESIFGNFDTDPGKISFDVPSTDCDLTVEVTRSLEADMPKTALAPGGKSRTEQVRTLVLPFP